MLIKDIVSFTTRPGTPITNYEILEPNPSTITSTSGGSSSASISFSVADLTEQKFKIKVSNGIVFTTPLITIKKLCNHLKSETEYKYTTDPLRVTSDGVKQPLELPFWNGQ